LSFASRHSAIAAIARLDGVGYTDTLDFVQHALLIMEKVGEGILGLWLAVFRAW
jgi:hypothetical protein